MLMGVILSVLVVLIVALISSTVSVKDSRSQAKSDKDTKVKEEEPQRIFSEQENEIEYPKFRIDKTFEEIS